MGPRSRLSARGRIGGGRVVRPPKTVGEALELRTEDDVTLSCMLHTPEKRPIGDVVLVHGAFSRQGSFTWSGGLADFFREAGYRVVTFDLRGHGKSGTSARSGGSWGYDELVRCDLPAVTSSLRARRPRGPLFVVGHSLGGHVALAAQIAGKIAADGIVTIASAMWGSASAPSRLRALAERVVVGGVALTAERRGFFPARRLRLGSDDEALGYTRDLRRMVAGGWRSADGKDDYAAGRSNVTIPVYAIASTGDRLQAPASSIRAFHAPLARCRVDVVDRSEDGGPPPDHAELVTTMKARPAFERALLFLREVR